MPGLELDFRAHGGNQRTVRSGARDAQEIARLAAGFFRGGEAQRDAAVRRVRRCARRRAANSTEATAPSPGHSRSRQAKRRAAPGCRPARSPLRSPCRRLRTRSRAAAIPRRRGAPCAVASPGAVVFCSSVSIPALRKMRRASSSCRTRSAASRRGIDDQHGIANFRRHLVHSVPLKRTRTKRTNIP